MTDATSTTTWEVDSQNERTRATPSGAIQDGYDVSFHTGQGHYGTVFVPRSKYNPTSVAEAVHAEAVLLDQVGSLRFDGAS